jgi:DNA invertase Pin-like site-specific DNA recombinase
MSGKIKPLHLERLAYVYIRQSTSAQVHEHVESKQRQYALAERAVSLGWAPTAVEIVDEDQGKSGASTKGRDGFARLAHEVAHGKVGAIFAMEVSRLARSSQDWQRLLSLCSVAHVVVIDEQAVYDPSFRDDKLLLDIKGAMSEQELHWLSLRLAGGRLNKARRGESYVTPTTGYVWGAVASSSTPTNPYAAPSS